MSSIVHRPIAALAHFRQHRIDSKSSLAFLLVLILIWQLSIFLFSVLSLLNFCRCTPFVKRHRNRHYENTASA